MATADAENLANGINNMKVDDANSNENAVIPAVNEFEQKWGLPVQDVYKIAVRFFKEKEGKGFQLAYPDKNKLVAFTKQAAFGKYRADVSPDVGFLDVVGKDRKQAWQSLGDMDKSEAMAEFVKQMAVSCALFEPHVQALKAEKQEEIKKRKEEEDRQKAEEDEAKKKESEESARQAQEAEKLRQQEQESQIRMALNQQTAVQFRQYAEQQYPSNKDMQEDLIKQLQEQHFQQYMQQVYQQQQLQQQQQQQQQETAATTPASTPDCASTVPNGVVTREAEPGNNNNPPAPEDAAPAVPPSGEDEEEYSMAVASMWTRKDIKEFKDSLKKDKESVIKIGSGETVTVRVPTHEDGTCLFWEFATDYYDIGFGVYFEWSVSQTNTVSVHISESSDEEELEEEEGKGEGKAADVEKGGGSKRADNRPPTDEIIPVYRRDCHEEVYCGSHTYPGQGVYLLKFDNSYSLWRSKTLYYRVYYSR